MKERLLTNSTVLRNLLRHGTKARCVARWCVSCSVCTQSDALQRLLNGHSRSRGPCRNPSPWPLTGPDLKCGTREDRAGGPMVLRESRPGKDRCQKRSVRSGRTTSSHVLACAWTEHSPSGTGGRLAGPQCATSIGGSKVGSLSFEFMAQCLKTTRSSRHTLFRWDDSSSGTVRCEVRADGDRGRKEPSGQTNTVQSAHVGAQTLCKTSSEPQPPVLSGDY